MNCTEAIPICSTVLGDRLTNLLPSDPTKPLPDGATIARKLRDE
jgi:hypothetical protein